MKTFLILFLLLPQLLLAQTKTLKQVIEEGTGGKIPTPAQVATWDTKGQSLSVTGSYNAATNVATLTPSGTTVTVGASSTIVPANGYLLVKTAGTQSIPTGSSQAYAVNDWLINSNGVWQWASNPNGVTTASVGLSNLATDAFTRLQNATLYDALTTSLVSVGQLNNGVVIASPETISVAVGQTGNSSFLLKTYLLANYPEWKVGHTIQLRYDILESVAGSSDTKLIVQLHKFTTAQISNVGTNIVRTRSLTNPNLVTVTLDYTIQSGDSQLKPYIQINNSSAVTGSDLVFYWTGIGGYDASSEKAGGVISDRIKTINSQISANTVNLQIRNAITVTTGGQAFNGASINPTTAQITIPSGQTGQSTYLQRPISNSAVGWNVGDKITFTGILVESVAGSATGLIPSMKVNVTRSGSTVQDVGTNASLTRPSVGSTTAIYSVDYTIQPGDTQVTPLLQISNGSSTTFASPYTFTWAKAYQVNNNAVSLTTPLTDKLEAMTVDYTGQNTATNALIVDNKLYFTPAYSSTGGESLNGATSAGTGVTVTSGQTGVNAYRTLNFPISVFPNWSDMVGVPVTFTFVLNNSTDLTLARTFNMAINVARSTSNANGQGSAKTVVVKSATVTWVSITYTPTINDTQLGIYLQFADNTVASTTQFFSVVNVFYNHALPTGYLSSNNYVVGKQLGKTQSDLTALQNQVAAGVTTTVLTVGAGKQYASPKLANDAILDASASKPYEILVYPGIYTETEWTVKSYVTIRGTVRDQCWLKGENADNSSDATISGTSTLWLSGNASLINLKITMRNGRYPVHSEASGANVNAIHTIQNCYIEHYGNEGAKTWRNANPGSGMLASTVWASCHAWGYGSASGVKETFENVTFVSPTDGWYIHSREDFTRPTVNELTNCRLIKTGPFGSGITLQPLGSGVTDQVSIRNSEISPGYISMSDNPWITQTAANQVANHAQFAVTVSNSSPYLGYLDGTRGSALRITSSSTSTGSSVRLAGTAVNALIGTEIARDGGGGLAGSAYGTWDISGIQVGINSNVTVANNLGRRLGDCSTTPKSLSVTFDGTTTKVISFSINFTSQSNATVLSYLNSALGASGTADEYNPSAGEFYPSFPERQVTLTNSSTTGIPRFSAVAYDNANNTVRLMTTSDPTSSFLGIALHNIAPNSTGRILTEGVMHKSQLAGASGATISFGTQISLSASTGGQFETSSSKPIGKGLATDWVYFKGNR
ncbi:hypothetical protein GCM10028805_43970 [Spirosoma harenae]